MRTLKSAVALAILTTTMTACSGASGSVSRNASSAPPSTFNVTGTMDVTPDFTKMWADAGGVEHTTQGAPCRGASGYDDITAGAQVAVRDVGGKVVAIGELSAGSASENAVTCTFALTVAGVPSGSAFYSVEVAHRGQVQFTSAAMQQPLSLNLR